ncbi:hypothetical protein Purlil1_12993 [Purpureocillium lilacinum]|uniref:2EXR domain-containing protein n=1 Tax=Purpureocillium lilacinum TaxID=33203 RepID=A0ABR0BFH9_PURLI|nr:hypothetical protein Purlil1_12993 [Purpureocillium lilacinum]
MPSKPPSSAEAAPSEDLTHRGADGLDPTFAQAQSRSTCPDDRLDQKSKDATACSDFPQFPKLPPELRTRIWDIALCEDDGPVLLPYRPDCQRLVDVSELDQGYIDGRKYWRAEFDPCLLDKTRVAMLPATVSRESHWAALSWMSETEVRPHENHHQVSGFVRPFDPRRDTLYIEAVKAEYFALDWLKLLKATHGGGLSGPTITRLAVSESLFRDKGTFPPRITFGRQNTSIFEHMLKAAPCANLILVVVGEQPEWEHSDLKVQRRWAVEDAGDYRLSWELDRQRFEVAAGQRSGGNGKYAWMEAICETWVDWLVRHQEDALEIRPVHAIRQGPGAAGGAARPHLQMAGSL